MAMQGDLDERDETAVADARELLDRVERTMPRSLEDDVMPMLDLMERGIDAAQDGDDPNEVFDETTSFDDVMGAARAIRDYQQEECGVEVESR